MLIFVDTDCLGTPTDTAAEGPLGLAGFEAVLQAWPQPRLVLTTERRHWTTLDRLRAEFAPALRPRIVGTTLFYGALSASPRPGREQEIGEWLQAVGADDVDWLALDGAADAFHAHAHRLLPCRGFGPREAAALQARLHERALRHEAVVRWPVASRPLDAARR